MIASKSIAQTQLSIQPVLLYFDYTEFSQTDFKLDQETGWLPGINAELSYINNQWKLSAKTSYYNGTVDYDGHTQSGTPHTTITDTELLRFSGKLGYLFTDQISAFAGFQQHRWDRNIQDSGNVNGLSEVYRWDEYSTGVDYLFYQNESGKFYVDVAYLVTRNAVIDVDLSRINLGNASLNIGNGSGFRSNITWVKRSTDAIRYATSLFFEAWDFGRSNTDNTLGGANRVFVTEPRSETRNIGLMFNISYIL